MKSNLKLTKESNWYQNTFKSTANNTLSREISNKTDELNTTAKLTNNIMSPSAPLSSKIPDK